MPRRTTVYTDAEMAEAFPACENTHCVDCRVCVPRGALDLDGRCGLCEDARLRGAVQDREAVVVDVAYLGAHSLCYLDCGHVRTLRGPAYPGLVVTCGREHANEDAGI